MRRGSWLLIERRSQICDLKSQIADLKSEI
jgi:hypothetical protein